MTEFFLTGMFAIGVALATIGCIYIGDRIVKVVSAAKQKKELETKLSRFRYSEIGKRLTQTTVKLIDVIDHQLDDLNK